MAKDTFYFSHDYNSRSDEKIKLLIRKHGILGYGIFWAIVEDLYNNANALRTDSEGIAFDLRVDKNIVESILCDFELFIIKDDFFGSLSVERRLNDRNLKSVKARESANLRWSKTKIDANAMRTQCDSNAIKERKVKESKENKKDNYHITSHIEDENINIIYSLYPSKCYIKGSNINKYSISNPDNFLLNNWKDYLNENDTFRFSEDLLDRVKNYFS